jgi:hypothetical protein
MNSLYYEKREIKANKGVIYFEKLILNDSSNYEVSYRIYDEASGIELKKNFTDVSKDNWYVDYISSLVPLTIVEGYPDQTFRPDSHITVAEFIKLTLYSLSYTDEMGSERWYDPYVEKAIDLNLISRSEYSDYNRPITREEMTKNVVKAFDEEPASGGESSFSDAAAISNPYLPYVIKAVDLGIIEGYPSDNTFRPKEYTTRAEAAKMFHYLAQDVSKDSFTAQMALSQEAELENRLYQDREDGSWKVQDFETKEGLIGHILPVLDNRELVERYVDRFYRQDEDGLYFLAQDGLTMINENNPYEFVMNHPREWQIGQEGENELQGHFKLMVIYQYDEQEWVMKDREVIRYDSGSETAYYEVLSQEEFSEEIQNQIESIRQQRGYALLQNEANESILYIGAGEKPTGGYTITVQAVQNLDGTTQVFVEETSPASDEAVSQAITYPMTIIKPHNLEADLQVITDSGTTMTKVDRTE